MHCQVDTRDFLVLETLLSHGLAWLSKLLKHLQISKCFDGYSTVKSSSISMSYSHMAVIHSNMKVRTGSEVGEVVSHV